MEVMRTIPKTFLLEMLECGTDSGADATLVFATQFSFTDTKTIKVQINNLFLEAFNKLKIMFCIVYNYFI